MKKSVLILSWVGLLGVVILTGWLVGRRTAGPLPASSVEPPSPKLSADFKKNPGTKTPSEALPSAAAATGEELSSERAGLLAKRILAAMTGGGSAEKAAALDPASLWDTSIPLEVRRQLAWRLAHSDDPADFQLLTEYLMSAEGDSRIKTLIVESMGESENPEAREWILSALGADDEQIVQAALRGLAKMDNPDDVKLFADLLLSAEAPDALRAEAALALGALSSPVAGEQLIAAYNAADFDDEVLREALINGLGLREIAETESFFRHVLATETNAEHRVSLVEAISEAKGDASSFLLDCLSDADSEVRAEAAWNMGMLEGDHGAALSELLRTESNPDVRQRLYEALDGQENIDVPLVLKRSLQEENVEVQLAAYTLVVAHLSDIEDPVERESAELVLTDEFEQMAVNGGTLNQRLRAVVGLRRIQTAGSDEALERVISQSKDPRVINATGVSLEEILEGE